MATIVCRECYAGRHSYCIRQDCQCQCIISDYPDEIDEYEDFEECPECGGEGWVVADCFEDTCCCADPELQHGMERCPVCGRR
jgi:hypothetical protein